MSKDTILVGAHTSAAGGVHRALLEGREIGATVIQLFTSNQKRWTSSPIDDDELIRWKSAKEETGISHVMSHDSYLINLGSPDEEIITKSLTAFKNELQRCHQLEISYLNFHPGAATTSSEEACLHQIIKSLKDIAPLAEKGNTRLLLETTAGQGSCVGYSFEHLAIIIEEVKHLIPIGVCIDTCHIFAAGYDIRTVEGCEHTLGLFDKIVGLKHLYAFHFNDSMKPFASKRDRHAPLGKGEIGITPFKFFMSDPRTRSLPKYLETPDGPPLWKEEIRLLKTFAKENHV